MGMCIHRIEFAQGLPSFDTISRQFMRQTGLKLHLLPTVHLPAVPLPTLQQLMTALARDAPAVADLEADYEAAQAPLRAARQYEEAAANRDRFKASKDRLAFIDGMELAVRFDNFHLYLIDVHIEENQINVCQYTFPSYPITSLVKSLLELGGQLQGADERRMRALHKEWRRLKWWQDYRWYNRPRW